MDYLQCLSDSSKFNHHRENLHNRYSPNTYYNTMRYVFFAAQNMGWTSGSTSNLVGWGGGSGGGNPGANAHGWVDEKGSGSKGTVGQVVDAVAEAAKAEGK